MSFDDLDLPPALREVIAELGYDAPTPIQAEALPLLLAGRDLVGRSRTGSGKTVAFGLPLLASVDVGVRRVQALVLCPTRELVAQVATALRTLGRRLPGLRVLAITGGLPRWPQQQALGEGVHVVVGTPGRVLDHVDHGALDAGALRIAVLDEADRMLDLGFQADVERLLGALPAERRTWFFSATYPRSIAEMSARWQRDPAVVTIADPPETPIRQVVHVVEAQDKVALLKALLAAHPGDAPLVFCNQKKTTEEVAQQLGNAFGATALHGDLTQRERDLVLAQLRNRSTRVVVATDVAARGLDVAGLDLVVNYDLPDLPETYVHRIGRTGRAGREGLAITLATPAQASRVAAIEAVVGPLEVGVPPEPAASPPPAADMVTLRIGGGRKEKVRPGDVLGALTGDAGLQGADVGRIEIHDHFAYVAVARAVAGKALSRLKEGRIKGRRFKVDKV